MAPTNAPAANSGLAERGGDFPSPLYTLIVAAYNAEKTLEAALDSLLRQQCCDWRAIVVDDGSVDSTYRMAEAYAARDDRFTVLTQANGGTGAARNAALPLVETEYCGYLDADDILSDTYSAVMANLMSDFPHHQIYSSDGVHVFADGSTSQVFDYGRVTRVTIEDMLDECWILGGGALIRTSDLRALGGYREHLYGEDYDLWMRAIASGLTHVASPEPLYVYHQSVEGQKSENRQAGNLSAVSALTDLLESSLLTDRQARQARARIRSRLAYPAIAARERARAEKAHLKAERRKLAAARRARRGKKSPSNEVTADSTAQTNADDRHIESIYSRAEARRVREEQAMLRARKLMGSLPYAYAAIRGIYRVLRSAFRVVRTGLFRLVVFARQLRMGGWRLIEAWEDTTRKPVRTSGAHPTLDDHAPAAVAHTGSSVCPVVSVVVPAYNAEKTLEETLDALRAQSYRDWECVVVDDGSVDSTGDIVRRFAADDARFRLVTQENQGSAGAYNTGVAHSRSNLIAICSADDILLPDHLTYMTRLAHRNPYCGLLSSNGRYLYDETGKTSPVYTSKPWDQELSLTLAEVLACCFFSVGAVYRRSVFDLVCGYRREVYGEDYDFWLRAMAKGVRHRYFPKTLSLHRVSNTQKSADILRVYESNIEVYKHLINAAWVDAKDVPLVESAIDARLALIDTMKAASAKSADLDGGPFAPAPQTDPDEPAEVQAEVIGSHD